MPANELLVIGNIIPFGEGGKLARNGKTYFSPFFAIREWYDIRGDDPTLNI